MERHCQFQECQVEWQKCQTVDNFPGAGVLSFIVLLTTRDAFSGVLPVPKPKCSCTPKTLSSKLSQRETIYFLLIILNGVTVSITLLYFRDKAKVINSLKNILKFKWAKCIILSSIRLASIGTLGIVSYRLV